MEVWEEGEYIPIATLGIATPQLSVAFSFTLKFRELTARGKVTR